MTYLEKAIERKAQIEKTEAERKKFLTMLSNIAASAEKVKSTPTITELRKFLNAVVTILSSIKAYTTQEETDGK